MKLSYTQRHYLHDLADGRGRLSGWGASNCNPTGAVLERLGYAVYEYDRSKSFPWGRWVITPAGLAALQPPEGP